MPHETTRPCLSCHAKRMITAFGTHYGYTVYELLHHVSDVLAELTATTCNDGHEKEAEETIKALFAESLKEAFAYEAQRKAAETAVPKAPTVSDVGHA